MYKSPSFYNYLFCLKRNGKKTIQEVECQYGGVSKSHQQRILSREVFILCLLCIFIAKASGQPSFLYESCQNDNGNYSSGSTYQANLNRVLTNLTSYGDVNGGGFYNLSYGQDIDRVYAIGLCRGDVEPDSCRSCLNQSTHLLTQICPSQKEAIGGFDECMLRYSNRSLFGLMETRPRFYSWGNRDVSSNLTNRFSRDLRSLFENLKNRTLTGDSLLKYAEGNYTAGDRELDRSLYAFAQCTPDLSNVDCVNCLDEAFGDILGPNGRLRVGGRVVTPSCNFRYEVFPFYGDGDESNAPTPTPQMQPTPSSPPPLTAKVKKSNKSRTIIIAVVPSVASVVLIISIGIYSSVKKAIRKTDEIPSTEIIPIKGPGIGIMHSNEIEDYIGGWPRRPADEDYIGRLRMRPADNDLRKFTRNFLYSFTIGVYSSVKKAIRKRVENRSSLEAAEGVKSAERLQFDFSTIRVATGNFSEEIKAGQGGFGRVYRGKLQDGQNIVVKCFNVDDLHQHYFEKVIQFGAKLHHRNLVRLLGFCLKGNKRFLLYELLPQSLDRLIFDPLMVENGYLDWDRRYRIVRGIAHGLLYLHEYCHMPIIHGNIKASKILLDEEMNPKITGVGMAKLFKIDRSEDTSMIMGTVGYIDQEYLMSGIASRKTDVYSFGVLLLEIVSGRKNISLNHDGEPEHLISTAWRNWREGTTLNIVDPQIRDGSEELEIMRCIHIGLLCVQPHSHARPTMSSVVHMLSCKNHSLPIPSEFGNYHENMESEASSSSGFNSGMIESVHSNSEIFRESANEVLVKIVKSLRVAVLVLQFVSKLKKI